MSDEIIVTPILIDPAQLNLKVGQTAMVMAEIRNVYWTSSPTGIVSIAPLNADDVNNGCVLVTALKGGSCTISAFKSSSTGMYDGSCSVTVSDGEKEYKKFFDNQRTIMRQLDETNIERIDVHSGLLCLEHADLSTDAILPASISHMYVSAGKFANNSKYGSGWRLSAQQTVRAENGYECVYTDALGKEHFFKKDTTNSSNVKTEDIDGLHMKFSGTLNGTSYITDRSGNKMTFNSLGNITHLEDKNQNVLTYNYTNNVLTSITDSQGKSLTLIYDSTSGKLSKITDPKNREVTFTYDSDNKLTKITDTDGLETRFDYYSDGRLDTVHARKNQRCYGYVGSSDKILGAGEYHSSSIGELGYEYYEQYLTYEDGRTSYVNEYNVRNTYILDEKGRCVTEYQDIRKYNNTKGQLTGCMNYTYQDNKCVRTVALRATDTGIKNHLKNGSFESMTGWTVTGSGEAVDEAFIDGTKSYKFNSGTGTKTLMQRVYLTGTNALDNTVGDTLFLSCWAKFTSVSKYSNPLQVKLLIKYSDDTESTKTAYFVSNTAEWQYNVATIKYNAQKTIRYVDVTLTATGVNQDTYFDNIRLVNTFSNTSNDDDDLNESINIFGVSETIKQRITKNNGIVTTITENGTHYLPIRVKVKYKNSQEFESFYKYDSKGNLIASQDYRGNVVLYTYDAKGNVIKTRAYHSDSINTTQSLVCPTKHFVNDYTYDGEFLTEEYDQRSEEIKSTFDYDTNSGLVNFDVDNNGQRTDYTYHPDTFAPTSVSTIVNGQNNCVSYSYTNRELTKITHNGFDYDFEYDGFGRRTKVEVAGEILSESVYTKQGNTLVCETTYGTGEKTKTTTDEKKRAVKTEYKKEGESEYTTLSETEYDDLGKVSKFVDKETNTEYTYTYDELGNLLTEKKNNNTVKSYEYDEWLRPKKITITENGTVPYTGVNATYITDHETNADGTPYPDNAVKKLTLQGVFSQTFDKDENQRLSKETITNSAETFSLSRDFTYLEQGNRLTGLVQTLKTTVDGSQKHNLKYYYDNNANIIKITEVDDGIEPAVETTLVEYEYDGLNRLTREDNYELGKTYTYGYNAGGNITHKFSWHLPLTPDLPFPYSYHYYNYSTNGWNDKLTSIDFDAGLSYITYDEVGNPINYFGKTLEWDKVRRLTKFDDITFEYNASGERTKKGLTEYINVGGNVHYETRYITNDEGMAIGYNTYHYYYGKNGVEGFTIDDSQNGYYFGKNLQGDITEIYNSINGQLVGKYVYDAWGNCTIVLDTNGIATLNPFRYRGYYYDTETGLYYIKSRYYDPSICRWISPDNVIPEDFLNPKAYNLYAYCFDNPVNMDDSTGQWPKWLTGALNVIGGAIQMAVGTALGVASSWTGIGAIAAGVLIVNGAATISQGIGQIINDVTNSNVMREDNIVKTGVETIGETIGGETGETIAGCIYDSTVMAAELYAGKVTLQNNGLMSTKVNINNVLNNPTDEFVTCGPAQGVISEYCRTIPLNGYGKIYATQLPNGFYQLANGHHRVAALRSLGKKTIKIFLIK